MAGIFDIGETVICSILVYDEDGDLQDPVTSMNIVIDLISPHYSSIITSTGMTKDTTGTYHYDFASASNVEGKYRIMYTATDGTRITKQTDEFFLV